MKDALNQVVVAAQPLLNGLFTKWALCKHIVAYSNLNSLDLYGARYRQPENFTQKTKRGAHKKISKALVRDE